MLAEKNPYIGSAYQHLQLISQDKKKRLEYEAREKAVRDYNQGMLEAREEGLQEGMEKGIEQGMEKGLQEGMEKGLQEGMEKGIEQGTEQLGKLIAALIASGRGDEVQKAATDKQTRDILYKEFNIL